MLSKIYDFFVSLFGTLIHWIGSFFSAIFSGLIDFLKMLFKPFLIIIAFVFYFIYELGVTIVLLFKFLLGIAQTIFALIGGIFKTLAGFTFSADTSNVAGSWSSIFGNLSDGMGVFQLDNIAYLLLFLIWFGTAFAAIKILASLRGAN
jgi:hypothetical protein